eukprot:1376673-Amorphochlora_amoeboformis.AAC.1
MLSLEPDVCNVRERGYDTGFDIGVRAKGTKETGERRDGERQDQYGLLRGNGNKMDMGQGWDMWDRSAAPMLESVPMFLVSSDLILCF